MHACMHHQQAYMQRFRPCLHACMHHQQAYMQRFRPCLHACMHHQQAYMQRFRPCPCMHAPPASRLTYTTKGTTVHPRLSELRLSESSIIQTPKLMRFMAFLVCTKCSSLESPLQMYLFTYPNKSLFILAQRGSDNRGCTVYIRSCESCQAQQKVVMPIHADSSGWVRRSLES